MLNGALDYLADLACALALLLACGACVVFSGWEGRPAEGFNVSQHYNGREM